MDDTETVTPISYRVIDARLIHEVLSLPKHVKDLAMLMLGVVYRLTNGVSGFTPPLILENTGRDGTHGHCKIAGSDQLVRLPPLPCSHYSHFIVGAYPVGFRKKRHGITPETELALAFGDYAGRGQHPLGFGDPRVLVPALRSLREMYRLNIYKRDYCSVILTDAVAYREDLLSAQDDQVALHEEEDGRYKLKKWTYDLVSGHMASTYAFPVISVQAEPK